MGWFKRKKGGDEPPSQPGPPAAAAPGSVDVEALKRAGDIEGLITVVREKLGGVNARGAAIDALGELGDPRAVQPLIEGLQPLVRIMGSMLSLAREEQRDRDLGEMLLGAAMAGATALKAVRALRKLGGADADAALAAVAADEALAQEVASKTRPPAGATQDDLQMILVLRGQAADLIEASGGAASAAAPPPAPEAPAGGVTVAVGHDAVQQVTQGLMSQQAPCRRCGTVVVFEEGGLLAMDRGIRDQVVMCKSCNAVYEVNLSPRGLKLLDDVTSRYET